MLKLNPKANTSGFFVSLWQGNVKFVVILKALMADLTQQNWRQQLNDDDNAVILDVRTQEEIEQGMIPKALHIDIYKGQGFIDELEELDKSKNYYVYCRSGARSAQACSVMNQLGFTNAYNLMGGFNDWKGDVE